MLVLLLIIFVWLLEPYTHADTLTIYITSVITLAYTVNQYMTSAIHITAHATFKHIMTGDITHTSTLNVTITIPHTSRRNAHTTIAHNLDINGANSMAANNTSPLTTIV